MKIKIKPKIQCFLVLYGVKPLLYTEEKRNVFHSEIASKVHK